MSIEEIVQTIAKLKNRPLANFTFIMLERERHNELLAKLRKMGVRIIIIADGDIGGSIVTCLPDSGVDLLIGAGAEATIAALAVKCIGGNNDSKGLERQKRRCQTNGPA
jgi:fructose-1,6-bisphosphatase II